MEEEEGPFEVLQHIEHFLEMPSNTKLAKSTLQLCYRHADMSETILDAILEGIRKVCHFIDLTLILQDVKNRRALFLFLATLYENPHTQSFRDSIEGKFRTLAEVGLDNGDGTTSPGWTRNAAKGLKALFQTFSEGIQIEFADVNNVINESLGLTEGEQEFIKRKQSILEQVERDREAHKLLREECWSRPEEEDLDQEFLALFDSSGELRLEDYKVAKDNLEIFCRLNDLNFTSSTDSVPIDKTLKPIVVLNLDEALFSLPDLRDSRDSKVRHAAQDLYECVKDVAKCCFFFNDVRDFDQPHCLYYRDEDDGRSLEGYDFKADELVEYLQGRSTEKEKKFYRERAFRYRMASIRYESNQNLEDLIPRDLDKECYRRMQDLNRILDESIVQARTSLERLKGLGIEVFVLTSLHLSLAMSLLAVIDLNSLIPARCLYSTSKYGLEWTLIEINSFRGSNPSHCIALGRGRDTDRCRKKLGWRYEEIHKARDLDRFIDDLEKSLLHNG